MQRGITITLLLLGLLVSGCRAGTRRLGPSRAPEPSAAKMPAGDRSAANDTISTVAHADPVESPVSEFEVSIPATDAGLVQMSQWQCVETALARHASGDVAQARLRAAIAQLDQAKSTFWPQLSSNLSITRIRQPITAEIPASALGVPVPVNFSLPVAGEQLRTASLDANLPLYAGGARLAGESLARAGVRIAKAETRLTENDTVAATRRAYFATVLTRQIMGLAEETRERIALTQELTARMLDAGSETVNRTDYLRGEIALSVTDAMIAEARHKMFLSRTALANAIGCPAQTEVEAIDAELVYEPLDVDLDQMVATALVMRPDWKQIGAAVCAAKAQIDLARSGLQPKVLASGSLIRLRDELDFGTITPNGDNWQIGIYAQVPLFTGFRTAGEIREAKARYAARRGQQRLLRDGIGVQVKAAFLDLIRTRDQIVATESAWTSATDNRELHVRAYQIGMVDTKDVLEAQLTETAMKKDHLLALHDWNVALVALDHATGRGLEQLLR